MRAYRLHQFGLENLNLETAPERSPGSNEVLVEMRALSLNFRDLMVVTGKYNPKLGLPAVPLSDGAGVVVAAGANVTRVRPQDRVMTHFVAGWIDGPFRPEYTATSLGTPGPGVAAERVLLPADAVLPIPRDYDFAEAATLPIAGLTAWSALRTVGHLAPGQTVLTLSTGGVSIFALQLAKALGARVIITSSSDEKLERAKKLGADHTINYRETPEWDRTVLELTGGAGADVTVETAGGETLERSIKATRAAGVVGVIGVVAGGEAKIAVRHLLMKRLRVEGIMVDSRAAFEDLVRFLNEHPLRPVIDRRFPFKQLPDALRTMQAATHFGKLVIDVV